MIKKLILTGVALAAILLAPVFAGLFYVFGVPAVQALAARSKGALSVIDAELDRSMPRSGDEAYISAHTRA